MEYEMRARTDRDEAGDEIVRLRLCGEDGVLLAENFLRPSGCDAASLQGLFDVGRYAEPYRMAEALEDRPAPAAPGFFAQRLAVFLGKEVLGGKMMEALLSVSGRRTLVVRLPAKDRDPLARVFASVPWEMAQTAVKNLSLAKTGLSVRVETEAGGERDDAALEQAWRREDENIRSGRTPLKVLLVFAGAPGSRPSAARREREALLDLFRRSVVPKRDVRADVLCCGATRKDLMEKIEVAGGFHVLHWSGCGPGEGLPIRGEDGGLESLSGRELADIFIRACGFVPRLAFLSAPRRETPERIGDRSRLRMALTGNPPDSEKPEEFSISRILEMRTGSADAALELIEAHFPQVAAMRFETGTDFAAEMGVRFYDRLLARDENRPADEALASARLDLLRLEEAKKNGWGADPAAPAIFGRKSVAPLSVRVRTLEPELVRPELRMPFLRGNGELEKPTEFVGREKELTQLWSRWLPSTDPAAAGSAAGDETPGVALLVGPAGIGKTALAAEALHLWRERFSRVVCVRSGEAATTPEAFFRRIDERLHFDFEARPRKMEKSSSHRAFPESVPAAAGRERFDRLRANLLECLRKERVLLIIDDFETHLAEDFENGLHPCADPEWDRILSAFARDLGDASSRALVVSSRIPEALKDDRVLHIPLEPLPLEEAAVFAASRLGLSGPREDESRIELAMELLDAGRGHPFVLDLLGALGAAPEALGEAVRELKKMEGFRALPDLFSGPFDSEDRMRVNAYLEKAAVRVADLAISRLSPDARRLLWVVSLGGGSIGRDIIDGVWAGRSEFDDKLEDVLELYSLAEGLPPELRDRMPEVPPDIREMLEKRREDSAKVPPLGPLLRELRDCGLVRLQTDISRESDRYPGLKIRPAKPRKPSKDEGREEAFRLHHLVGERIRERMGRGGRERMGRVENEILVAFAGRFAALCNRLRSSGRRSDRKAAAAAAGRALDRLIRADALSELSFFVSGLPVDVEDAELSREILAELGAAAEAVPRGKRRWRLLARLADALGASSGPDRWIPFFRKAAEEAEAEGCWSDAAKILGAMADALRDADLPDEARDVRLESARAFRNAGDSEVRALESELEAFRIDVDRGKAEEALPEIESRLEEIRGLHEQAQDGKGPLEIPYPDCARRVRIAALDIARKACRSLERWRECLDLLDEAEAVRREAGRDERELCLVRFERFEPLSMLGRLEEARRTVEACLETFREKRISEKEGEALSALASIRDLQDDPEGAAALERRALHVRDSLPDMESRAASHGDLSDYLFRARRAEESASHLAAAIAYRFAAVHREASARSPEGLKNKIRRTVESGGDCSLPPVADLLRQPEFQPLARFLADREADISALQSGIDRLIEAASLKPPASPRLDLSGLPQELQVLFAELADTVSEGLDPSDATVRLKAQFLEIAPGMESEIEAVIENVIRKLRR